MNNIVLKAVGITLFASALTGCVGSNAVTGKVMKFNLEAVDNRYARAGVNFLLAPVYGITSAADYVVFNSLEFWTGKNPITDSPHIFDSKVETHIKVNDDLDPSLQEAPISPISNNRQIDTGEMIQADENSVKMHIVYNNGETAVLEGFKNGENVSYYMDGKLVAQTTIAKLAALNSHAV
ncbi:DUF3332 domain-containing protein [Photobacterium gaetbulicola]|uniref:ABC-type multidrug transport system, ATPase and permease component n=1 Tax=Photobacterium gaetbulicola Gung47 TaxID=658445 RepID=A0A0C5WR70_9GAMM|nr:DUF3332 family protein [Photobacterium gaetbulicola]AJR08817.1 ABC-type multidrug transport system, ATPase and permease component [Photobacterium gaetbulicola Gung47]PSU13385.1 DUF3332 domain-containing protein [Photobacterium gaetbulicola]